MRRTKAFLRKYKAYLHVLPTVLFAGVSAYYAIESTELQERQLLISEEQKSLAMRQAELDGALMKVQQQAMMPVFSVGVDFLGVRDGKRQEELRISADRNPAFNTSYRLWARLNVERRKSQTTPISATDFATSYRTELIEHARLPILHYVGVITHIHDDHAGLLISAPIEDTSLTSHVEQTLSKLERDPLIDYQVLLERFVMLRFSTADGSSHEKFFVLNAAGRGRPVTATEFQRALGQIEQTDGPVVGVDTDDLSKGEIVAAWQQGKRKVNLNRS